MQDDIAFEVAFQWNGDYPENKITLLCVVGTYLAGFRRSLALLRRPGARCKVR